MNKKILSILWTIGIVLWVACSESNPQFASSTTSTENVVQLKIDQFQAEADYQFTLKDSSYIPLAFYLNPRPEFNQEIEVNSAGELSISEWDTKFSILETRLGDLVAWNFIQTSDVETIEDQVIQLDSSKVLVGQVEFPRISGYDKVFVGIAGTNIVQDITSKTTQFNELNSPIDTVVFEFDGVIGDMPIENYQLFVYWSRTSEDRNVLFRKSSLITPLGIGKR